MLKLFYEIDQSLVHLTHQILERKPCRGLDGQVEVPTIVGIRADVNKHTAAHRVDEIAVLQLSERFAQARVIIRDSDLAHRQSTEILPNMAVCFGLVLKLSR